MKAIWKGAVRAESDDKGIAAGNHYVPRASVKAKFLTPSDTTTFCSWKGAASYESLSVDRPSNRDAVWPCALRKDAAKRIRGRVALCNGVKVTD